MKEILEQDRFIVSVKVGPKGQITIPAQARRMFSIKEGDTLMVMGDRKRGIALLKDDLFYQLMGQRIALRTGKRTRSFSLSVQLHYACIHRKSPKTFS